MIAVKTESQYDKLQRRRNEVARTLDHVRGEQQCVDENKQWIGRSAYVKRCRLLDSLRRWYAEENQRIEAALRRINEGGYGVCAQCRQRIDDQTLERCPETSLCADCLEMDSRRRTA